MRAVKAEIKVADRTCVSYRNRDVYSRCTVIRDRYRSRKACRKSCSRAWRWRWRRRWNRCWCWRCDRCSTGGTNHIKREILRNVWRRCRVSSIDYICPKAGRIRKLASIVARSPSRSSDRLGRVEMVSSNTYRRSPVNPVISWSKHDVSCCCVLPYTTGSTRGRSWRGSNSIKYSENARIRRRSKPVGRSIAKYDC